MSLKNENTGPGYNTAKPLVSIWHWKEKQSPGVIYIKEKQSPGVIYKIKEAKVLVSVLERNTG